MTSLKGKYHHLDGISRRRPRRGRGVFGRTRASSGGVGAALPAFLVFVPDNGFKTVCQMKWVNSITLPQSESIIHHE